MFRLKENIENMEDGMAPLLGRGSDLNYSEADSFLIQNTLLNERTSRGAM